MSALTVTFEVDTAKLSARLKSIGGDATFMLGELIIDVMKTGAPGATAMSIMEGYGVRIAELLSTDAPVKAELRQ